MFTILTRPRVRYIHVTVAMITFANHVHSCLFDLVDPIRIMPLRDITFVLIYLTQLTSTSTFRFNIWLNWYELSCVE